MSDFTQTGQQILLNTPLGKDKLLLTSINGLEEVSRLFSFQFQMLSKDDALSPEAIVGKSVVATLKLPNDTERYFSGFIKTFSFCGTGDRFSIYTAECIPWLWFLTLKFDCRIFQNQSVPDIIKLVFDELGFLTMRLQKSKVLTHRGITASNIARAPSIFSPA